MKLKLRFRLDRDGRMSVTEEDGEAPENADLLPPDDDQPEDPFPRTPLDAWWTRRFPPNSRARLVFVLIAFPIVGAIYALWKHYQGEGMSLAQYLFVSITGDVLIAFLWISGALRPSGQGGQAATPTAPPRRSPARDFLVALPFSFAAALVVSLVTGGLDGSTVVVSVIAGLAIALLVALRRSIWSVVIFSLLVGFGAAVFLQLFLLFMGGESSFVGVWMVASLFVFAWALPCWLAVRRGRFGFLRRFPLPDAPSSRGAASASEPPLWILMTGTLILVVASAIFFTITDGDQSPGQLPMPVPVAQADTEVVGAATAEAASGQLLQGWRLGSRRIAEEVAVDQAVDLVLATPFPRGARLLGCGTLADGSRSCAIEAGERFLLLATERSEAGATYIVFAEWASAERHIRFD
jgi:hypothetical protein